MMIAMHMRSTYSHTTSDMFLDLHSLKPDNPLVISTSYRRRNIGEISQVLPS